VLCALASILEVLLHVLQSFVHVMATVDHHCRRFSLSMARDVLAIVVVSIDDDRSEV
jgi:hypothetical protein